MKLAMRATALARILLSDLVGNTQARPHPPVIRSAWSTLDRARVESQSQFGERRLRCTVVPLQWLASGCTTL